MLARLQTMGRRFDEIEAALANPEGGFDQARYTAMVKERSQLEPPVAAFRALEKLQRDIEENEALARESDGEMRELAEDEAKALRARREQLEDDLQQLMIPRDPDDDKDVFIEIRGGAGGDEAAIFAGDLARMYLRYAENEGMKTELVSASESDAGGYKEIVIARQRRSAVPALQARVGGPSRAARARDRSARPHPYQHLHRGRAAAGRRRRRDRDQIRRLADRYVQSLGCGRPVRQQNRIGNSHHARPLRHHRRIAAGALADAEPRKGDADAPRDALRPAAPRARRSDGVDAPLAGRHRRSFGEDPHVQLSRTIA